jgi:hypothetical protein
MKHKLEDVWETIKTQSKKTLDEKIADINKSIQELAEYDYEVDFFNQWHSFVGITDELFISGVDHNDCFIIETDFCEEKYRWSSEELVNIVSTEIVLEIIDYFEAALIPNLKELKTFVVRDK